MHGCNWAESPDPVQLLSLPWVAAQAGRSKKKIIKTEPLVIDCCMKTCRRPESGIMVRDAHWHDTVRAPWWGGHLGEGSEGKTKSPPICPFITHFQKPTFSPPPPFFPSLTAASVGPLPCRKERKTQKEVVSISRRQSAALRCLQLSRPATHDTGSPKSVTPLKYLF